MNENRVGDGNPVILYVYDVKFIEEIPGYVCPEEFWGAFESDAPDLQLHDFATEQDRNWETSTGPKSSGSFEFVEAAPEESEGYSIKISYSLHDWVDIIYNYRDNNSPAEHRDWTNHWGLKFDVYTERAFQPFNVQVNDSGNELWIATAGAEKGWTEVIVAFRDFYKFPHWQPPDAVHTGNFDIENVIALDFKPSGEGTSAQFKVHNVRLTNDREARRAPVPEYVAVNVTGSFDEVVTEQINEGIFGINAALWDGDLLLPETVEYVKAVNHHVLRYPGGLRADDDNWKEVLAAQDWMVDTDQFLEFCRATNTEAMITVNFGSGTVEDAADWVRHHNVENDDNVRYWEVGNELYGDWHPFQTTAEDYGKRTREFIIAMKEVDPTIKVTFVGVLDGEWNRIVLEHVKDVADGINVHHYPQTTGEENDAGLLSSPQTLDDIIPSVRRQLAEWGEPGREYEIWLTEWNSVDFEPGPQTLSIVNGLFVADYLGMLAKHNIEQASYWDIHNDITDQGGDYGYLSRTGAPDGCNVPRPSYWAFKMASHSLGRGSLLNSGTESDYVTSYLTYDNGKKSLMLVNKYPQTRADVTINIPGFEGRGTKQVLTAESGQPGPEKGNFRVRQGTELALPPYSITTITLD
nr:putative cellulase [uncultured bacterium]